MELRKLREKVSLTATKVADHLDVAESSVRNWEKGRSLPRLRADQFDRLCDLYNCTIKELAQAVRESKNEAIGHDE